MSLLRLRSPSEIRKPEETDREISVVFFVILRSVAQCQNWTIDQNQRQHLSSLGGQELLKGLVLLQ